MRYFGEFLCFQRSLLAGYEGKEHSLVFITFRNLHLTSGPKKWTDEVYDELVPERHWITWALLFPWHDMLFPAFLSPSPLSHHLLLSFWLHWWIFPSMNIFYLTNKIHRPGNAIRWQQLQEPSPTSPELHGTSLGQASPVSLWFCTPTYRIILYNTLYLRVCRLDLQVLKTICNLEVHPIAYFHHIVTWFLC